MVIGVISDTHGLLRPEAVEALRGSDLILHAGDVGGAEILDELAKLAAVRAIRGNVDTEPPLRKLPDIEVVEVDEVSIYVIHNVHDLDLNPRAAGLAAVVSGHSHKPAIETRDGVLYFNPGSAGPRRFSLPVTVGKLRIRKGKLAAEVVELQIAK